MRQASAQTKRNVIPITRWIKSIGMVWQSGRLENRDSALAGNIVAAPARRHFDAVGKSHFVWWRL